MQELRLEKNKLTYFKAGVFEGLVSLKDLYLHSNSLRALPDGLFFNLKSLAKIQLSNNQLDTMNACAFQDVTTVKEVNHTVTTKFVMCVAWIA